MPADLRPEMPTAASKPQPAVEVDGSLYAVTANWRLVIAELMERGIDLYDPAVLDRPWPGVRALIFSLLDSDTRFRAVLTRR